MAKESSASRRARVKFQLRDRKGRWIEMGRGVKWYSPRLGREVSGTVVGSKGRNAIVDITSEPAGVTGKPQQVSVKGTDIEVIANKASIGAPAPKPSKPKAQPEKAKIVDDGGKDKAPSVKSGITPEMQKEIDRQMGRGDEKDEANPVVATEEDEDLDVDLEDPDAADLEEVDVDEDLDEDEAEADEDVDTSPTSADDLEATIEELEAVVEEVASGDLDDNEIDEKLAEEVYSVYGKDGKQYDLDVKKDLEGKWNYRLRDAEGRTRKIYAMVPADENDSVDAGAKLHAVMNPKTKAKATTAKPEEKAPEAKAAPEPESVTPDKPKVTVPARRPAAKQPKLDIKGLKNVKRNGNGDYESTDMSERLMERLPVGTEISSVDTGQLFVKVAPNRWAEPDGIAQKGARELKDVDFLGEGDDSIFLPGSDSNNTDAAEIERLTAVLDKNAEETQAKNREYEESVKAREEAKKQAAPVADVTPEEEAPAEAADDAVSGIKATKDGDKVKLEGYELTTVKDLEEGDSFIPISEVDGKGKHEKYVTMDAADRVTGETSKHNTKEIAVSATATPVTVVTKNSEATYVDIRQSGGQSYSGKQRSHGRGTWQGTSGQATTALGRNNFVLKNTPEVREALAKAGMNIPVPPKEMSRDELINEAGDLDGLKHEADITGMGDRQFTPKHQARLDTLNKELKTRKDTPAPTKAKKDRDRRNLDIDLGTHKQENTSGLKKQHFDTGEPGGAEMWVDSEGDIVVSDTRELEALGDGTDDDLLVSYDESRQTGDVRFPDGSRKHWRMTTDAEEEGIKPKAVPETPQDAPEATDTPEEQKADTVPENPAEAADAWTPEPVPAPTTIAQTDEEADAAIAALMAEQGIERTEPTTMEGEKYPPTRQQQDVIDAVMAGKDTKVQAMAGTGKTSTLEALSRRLQVTGKQAVYIAFNKTVQTEAAERMPKNVEARTGHSLANAWASKAMPFLGIRMENKDPLKTFVNPKTKKTEPMPKVPITASDKIARVLGIGEKSVTVEGGQGLGKTRSVQAVKRMVNSYQLSDSDEVGPEHIPAEFSADDAEFVLSEEGKTALVGFAKAYWGDLSREDGVFRVAHDTYRKHWALSRPDLTDGTGGNKGADVLYIDEAQDTPAVLAKVVADQNMQKVIVGDANQAIYAFAENIDYLSEADSDIELPLNKSWRFGPVVADAGNRFLELLEAPNRVVGGGGESKRVVGMEDADAVLVRTNAGMVDAVLEEAENGRRVSAPDGTRDNLKSLATSVQSLMNGERPEKPHDDLVGYKNWDEVLTAFYQKDPSVQTLTKLFDVTDAKQLSKMTPDQHEAARENAMARVNKAIDAIVERVDGFKNLKKTVVGKRTYLEVADDFQGTDNQRDFAVLNFAANLGRKKDPYAADASDSWVVKNKAYRAAGLGILKADGWRFDGNSMRWYSENADTVAKFDTYEGEYDVMVSTAHKSKGLEWDRVRIGYDFPAPRQDENTGVTVMPEDAEYKLAYVAATRAKKELDMGGLDYVYEMTSENGGLPKARKGDSDEADAARVEDGAVTPEAVPEPEDNTDVPATEAEAARYDDAEPAEAPAPAAPEAPQAPEVDEVTDESVPEAAPEAPEAAPESVDAPEPTPAPAATPGPVEVPEKSAPEDTTPDPATPVDGLDDDGLTPAEASYAGKLQKAISDGYRTGIGNIQALQERLDEIYDRGAARLRGEDPDAAPEAAPEVKPAVDEEPATPEAEEEVVPEAEEVVEEAPEPTPETPVEAEAEPVEVVEEPTEEGPQGDASDGEEEVEAPTDLDSFEATASELFTTFQDVQKTPRTPQELQDILEAEIYLLRGEDGNGYEFGLDVDDKGKWSYLLADEEGNELERYNVMTVSPEEAGQKAFERVNGSQESETTEEAPVDPADATPEAEEEVVDESDRVEPEEAPEVDPEVVPEPTPMPEVEVEEDAAPEAQTPEEAPQETPEVAPEGGTAPAEPDARPLHPVKQKAHNYPDGTQIKAARTDELIEKTKGKWHVAGSPSKAADPMAVEIPLVVEMPAQADDSFTPFDGNMDSLVPGDIIRTENGNQAAVIGIRDGKVMAMAHGVPANRKALRPNTVSVGPSKIKGVNKFDAPAPEAEAPTAPAVSRTRTKSAGGTPIMDVDGNETKLGDRVMTAIGQGEVIALRPKSGPNGSVLVRMDDGKEKSFRSNKFTNAAFAELLEGDDPATMEVGAQGTGADGRKFLVGKGNKPIYKGDRVELADGRVGTVAGIYAGVKSAGVAMEDGSTTRKKVSTLNAIDYAAPEKDTTVVEEPTPEAAPEVETTVEAPEVEAVVEEDAAESDPAVQPDASEEWASTKLSQDAKRVFDEHGLTPSQFRSLVTANAPDSFVNARTGRDSLSDMVSGENTEDLWEAAQTVTGVRTLAVIMSVMKTYNPAMDSSAAEGVDLDAFAKSIGVLESKYSKAYKDTLKSLADVSPTKMTPAEIASYNAEVDFSGFDPSTSKLNPLSDAGKSFGDVKNRSQDAKPEGVKVRNKQTGALGMVRGSTSDGEAYVTQAGVTGAGGPDTLGQVSWSDLELVDVSAQVGTPDIAGATDNEGVAAAMSEAFPNTHFDFEGMTTDGAKQYAETMTRLFNKFPQSRLSVMQVISETAAPSQNADAVARGLSGAAMATTWTGNVRATGHAVQRIEVNAASEKDIHHAHRSSERFHNHIDEGKGMEYTITHEFGHALDGQTGWTSRETIEGFLKQLYPNFKAGRDEYKLLYKEFSGYSFNRKTGRVDTKEIVAEAFADAELNATEAKPLSKLIHQYLMERLREV